MGDRAAVQIVGFEIVLAGVFQLPAYADVEATFATPRAKYWSAM